MDDPGKPDPVDPCWSLLADPHSSDNVYFTQRDHNNNILADFGWTGFDSETPPLVPPTTNTSSVAGPSSSSLQSASTSSSEDQPQRSVTTAPSTTPAEIPSKVISKKKGQKRVRQARFAFMTKSEVDNLEDGYRWRKYGQKAVKNSPYPRSYYRCTNSKCTVKKRVERSWEDQTVVITTYEGQHCHHTVGFQRSSGFLTHEGHFLGQFPPPLNPPQTFFYRPPPGPQFCPTNDSISVLNTNTQNPTSFNSLPSLHQGIPCKMEEFIISPESSQPPPPHTDNPRAASPGEGLLGDIVPPGMRNRTLEDM